MSLYQFIVTVVDAIVILALSGASAVGLGFLMLPTLYLLEWAQGRLSEPAEIAPQIAEEHLPDVLVQLPVFNEPTVVVEGLLESVAALDWPRSRLHIQLLDDSANEFAIPNALRIAGLRMQDFDAEQLRRTNRDGYKAGALAAGLACSTAPYVAILDADFRPPSSWLKVTISRLVSRPDAAFIQSRCEFSNADTNWLTRAQSLLFDSHFLMEQGVRARAGMLFQFNGTGGVWRRQAIEDAGGWATDSLCEDLDLTIRAAIAGWTALFSMHPAVAGLVPDRVRHWRVQQRRWASGFAQIARKLSVPLWTSSLSFAQKVLVGFLILYQAALPALAIAAIALVVDIALRHGAMPPLGPLLAITVVLAVAVSVGMTLPPYLELRRGSIGRYLRDVVTLPPLVLYLSLANARPMVAAFFGRREVFKRTPKSRL